MAEFRTSADHLCPIARKTISKLGKTFPPNSRFKRNNVFIYKTNKTLNQLFSSAHWQRHGHRTYWWSINNQSWKIRSSSLLKKELLFLARLEICQKIYTTGFSDQKFYTLKMRNLQLFLLKKNRVNALLL